MIHEALHVDAAVDAIRDDISDDLRVLGVDVKNVNVQRIIEEKLIRDSIDIIARESGAFSDVKNYTNISTIIKNYYNAPQLNTPVSNEEKAIIRGYFKDSYSGPEIEIDGRLVSLGEDGNLVVAGLAAGSAAGGPGSDSILGQGLVSPSNPIIEETDHGGHDFSEVEYGPGGERHYNDANGRELWNDVDYVGTHITESGGSRTTSREVGGYTHTVTAPSGGPSVTYTESLPSTEFDWFGGADIPIILDLDGDGIELTFGENIFFDIDGDGYRERTSWASADDGFLVIDLNADGTRGAGDGIIDQADELVWANWIGAEFTTDLQALSLLEQLEGWGNNDGVLNAQDAVWNELRVWRDIDQDGETDAGELFILGQVVTSWVDTQDNSQTGLGITSINLSYDNGSSFDDHDDNITVFGNTLFGEASYSVVSNANGTSHTMFGGVGDVALSNDELGYRRVETSLGYTIEFESGEELRYAELDGSTPAHINLATEWLHGATGDGRSNTLNATGHSLATQISGGDGNDTITGGQLDDMISGDAGADILLGADGNDVLFFDEFDTTVDGGTGEDIGVYTSNAALTMSLFHHNIETLFSGDGADNLSGGGVNAAALAIHGGGGADIIHGGELSDTLSGDDGNDYISDHFGDDSLLGGAGSDTLSGGVGDDTLLGGEDGDTLNGGDDDDFLLGGHGADALTGGSGDDYLDGGSENDVLDGGYGDDILRGGDGNDTLTAGHGDDRLKGGAGNDSLIAGDGADALYGEDGNDTFFANATQTGYGNLWRPWKRCSAPEWRPI